MCACRPAALALLLCSVTAGAALADEGEERPADEGFARIEARLCNEFEVCEPPCGSSQGDAEAGAR